jgi:hypothetical protein
MTPRNHLSEAARIPQKRSSAFFIKLPRSTGSIATQFQSNLELLQALAKQIKDVIFEEWLRHQVCIAPA